MLLLGSVLSEQYKVDSFDIAPFVGFHLTFRCSSCVANQRVSVDADFGAFKLGPLFAVGEESGENSELVYTADFECGLFTGGDAA